MDLKIFAKTVDEKALQQINTLASIDAFKESKIRIMPDVHAGAGCVISRLVGRFVKCSVCKGKRHILTGSCAGCM